MISMILSTICVVIWGLLTGRVTYAAVETYRDYLKGQIDTWWGNFKFNWGYYGREFHTLDRVSWTCIAWLAQCGLVIVVIATQGGRLFENSFEKLFDKIGRWL